jgi:hypothetical protein
MPKKIVLLSCVATKLPKPAPAGKLYNSPLFKGSLEYANSLDPDDIIILSAKHYVLPLEQVIAPYDKTLLNMPSDEVKEWAEEVLRRLRKSYDLENDEFIILAGAKYRKYIVPEIKNWSSPVEGKRIGQQLQFYAQKMGKAIKEGFIKLVNLIFGR